MCVPRGWLADHCCDKGALGYRRKKRAKSQSQKPLSHRGIRDGIGLHSDLAQTGRKRSLTAH